MEAYDHSKSNIYEAVGMREELCDQFIEKINNFMGEGGTVSEAVEKIESFLASAPPTGVRLFAFALVYVSMQTAKLKQHLARQAMKGVALDVAKSIKSRVKDLPPELAEKLIQPTEEFLRGVTGDEEISSSHEVIAMDDLPEELKEQFDKFIKSKRGEDATES